MKPKKQKLIKFIKKHRKGARFSEILKAGFHPDTLNLLKKEKKISKIARGIYVFDYAPDSYPDIVTALLQVPKGVICLLSALAFHEVTTEIPRRVDIAIPRNTRMSKVKYPPVKFYRFGPKAWKAGIEKHEIEGYKIQVYSLPKTIADCFKFRNRIGINIARDALKIAITEKDVKPKDIMQYAKICRVSSIVKPILEAML